MSGSTAAMDSIPESLIHPTAVVDTTARLAPGVRVGPYAVIGADVSIGANTSVGPHAVIEGPTRIGCDNRIHAHACLGGAPQDLHYKGEDTALVIGDGNIIREFVSIHRGTPKDRGQTRVGSHNMLMAGTHVGHDCVLGDRIIMANGSVLGGHVQVQDQVNISGQVAVHQFTRIGRLAMVAGGSIVLRDIPPFMLAQGNSARLRGLNARGLERAGLSVAARSALKKAYRVLYRSGLKRDEALHQLALEPHCPELQELLAFFSGSRREMMR